MRSNYKVRWPVVLSMLLLVWGCAGKPAESERVRYYMLEYKPPEITDASPLDAIVRVDRFTAVSPYNQTNMVYKDKAYQRNSYFYQRWRVSPPDMVADFVARDLRSTDLYRAVLRNDAPGRSQFQVEGDILMFGEDDEPDGWFAVVELEATLTDMRSRDTSTWVVWQKNYRYRERCAEKNPERVVEAMSRAVAALSGALSRDLYDGIRGRLEKSPPGQDQPASGQKPVNSRNPRP